MRVLISAVKITDSVPCLVAAARLAPEPLRQDVTTRCNILLHGATRFSCTRLTVLSCRVCSAPAMRKFVLKVVEEVAKYKPVRTAR